MGDGIRAIEFLGPVSPFVSKDWGCGGGDITKQVRFFHARK